jgi:hypothetical protein
MQLVPSIMISMQTRDFLLFLMVSMKPFKRAFKSYAFEVQQTLFCNLWEKGDIQLKLKFPLIATERSVCSTISPGFRKACDGRCGFSNYFANFYKTSTTLIGNYGKEESSGRNKACKA